MRFKQFLQERTEPISLDAIAKEIADKCSPFLKLKTGPLLRGWNKNPITGYWEHPVSRAARDSTPGFNFMFNAGIDAAYGIENVRTHSVFASGSLTTAEDYGKPAFFFPAGNFKYIWSKFVEDSFLDEDGITDNIVLNLRVRTFGKQAKKQCNKEDLAELFSELTRVTQPHTWINDLRGKSEDQTENLAPIDLSQPYLFDHLTAALADTFKELYIDSKELDEAVSRNSEIFFYESDGYYLVSIEDIKDKMGSSASTEQQYSFLMDAISGHLKTQKKHK